ncbi:hypothetical protein J7K99_06525, partial [bacterium]|nr:hypothetical protein [bacterium]
MRFTGWMMLIVSVVSIVWGGFVGNWEVFGNANDCLSIVSDGSSLWLGTSGGVVRYEPSGNYNIYTTLDGLGALKISSLTVDSNGYVWYVSENGYVGAFVDGMWRTADELAQNFYELNKIRYYNGRLWIASNKGIVRAKPVPTSFTVVQFEEYIEHFADFPSQIAVNDIEFFHDTIFAATEYGIAFAPVDANLINPAVWETTAVWDTIPEGGVISRGVKALGVYHDTLWILAVIQNSGDHSLYYFDGSHISKKTLASSFSRDANEICTAADTMWIVDETGVFFYSESDNNMVRVSVDAPLMGAREVTECSGKVYFATRYGIGWTEGGKIEVLAFNSMYGSAISDVVFPGDTAVVATPGCVNIFDGTHWSFLDYYTYYLSVSDYPSSTLNTIRVIFGLLRSAIITPDGVLWLGSYGSGLLKIYPDSSFEIWNDTTSCLATSGS